MASASSMPPTDQSQDLKRLLECSICLETFDDPRTLPCLHSFCKKCLENFVDGKRDDELNCPVCRGKFTLNEEGVAGMTRNHFICNMVEVLSIQDQNKCIPCSHCEQPTVGRCVTCELFMCEKCLQSHNGYIGFRDHVVLTMEELSKPENQSKIKGKSYCKKHPSKKLKLYCETCEELICTYCMSFEHVRPDHVCSPLEEIAERKRKELKTKCEILQRTVADKNKEAQSLKKDIELLNNKFDKAQRLTNEREEQLLGRLQAKLQIKTILVIEDARQVFYHNTGILEERIHQRETFVNRVKASTDMARSLLENGNDEEIVRSYQYVVNNDVIENDVEENENDDTLLSLSSDEIDTMLLAEIKDLVQNKDASPQLVEKAPTSKKQWYSGDERMESLQLLFQYFQQAGITPDVSKIALTQDIQFGLSGGYCLDVPPNFPSEMPTIRAPDGSEYELNRRSKRDKDVCGTVVRTVVDFLRNPPQSSRRVGRRTSGGRGGSNY